MKYGIGKCNGTFGELVQGVIAGYPFLITLPISIKSTAVFIPNNMMKNIAVFPIKKQKARGAVIAFRKMIGVNFGGTLYLQSEIPEGKGMASSSADIVASLRAVANAFSLKLTEEIISKISILIEPTDGVMYEEVVAYNYLDGTLIEVFVSLPPIVIIGIDTGGTVDTVIFNKQKKHYTKKELYELEIAYYLARDGIATGNLSKLFAATTKSALISQKFLGKLYFSEFYELAQTFEVGLVVAHSGTMLGLIVDVLEESKIELLKTKIFEKTGKKASKFYGVSGISSKFTK